MTHEFKRIIQAFELANAQGIACVLVTVVALDGSSYRRPGVRMLLQDNGKMTGAVSGGCVEKEVLIQAATVFKSKVSKVMTYDGRYRLGCEGVLYILLEFFDPTPKFINEFWTLVKNRRQFKFTSYFQKEFKENSSFGSILKFDDKIIPINQSFIIDKGCEVFEQILSPCFKLLIIGAEHDAVQLCAYAAMTGWEVTIVVNPKEQKELNDFPGANEFIHTDPELLDLNIDEQTAVVLMTHSYAKDLQYLISLKDMKLTYLGLLGPTRRREKIFNDLIERESDISDEFLSQINGPAGLAVGAETPQEIAISIISEILSIVNKKELTMLKNKQGSIHS